MRRRAVLQSLAAGTSAAAIALAGCNALGNSGGTCGTPDGELQAALPGGRGVSRQSVDTNNSAQEVGGARRHVFGSYETDDGETMLFIIGEYTSETTAREAAEDKEIWAVYGDEMTGHVVVKQFAYVVLGPSQSAVEDLMAAAGPLNESCVEDEIAFL